MREIRVLIANEPLMYREALVEVLKALRPQARFDLVEPDCLDEEIARLHPHLVVSSKAFSSMQDRVLTWVTLYPNGENWAEIVTAGGRAILVGIQFDDFLSIVDGTELRRRLAREEGLKA